MPDRPTFLERWKERLVPFEEPSERSWAASETPLGDGNLDHIKEASRILDIGCGSGFALDKLRASGKEVYGIDLSPYNVKKSFEKGLSVVEGDMHDLPFDDGSFDGIVLWDVLEHAFAPVIVLKECHRVLRNNGKMVIFIPPETWADHPVHVTIPTQKQLEVLLRHAHLTLVNHRDVQSGGTIFNVDR